MECQNNYIYNYKNNKEFYNFAKTQVNIVNSPNNADCIICYGGDGTLLDVFQQYPDKAILPIRNHSRCEKHQQINLKNTSLSLENIIEVTINNKHFIGLSELVIKNQNITKAMRCSLKINNKEYAGNIIGDGIICCTPLGSTGYFKNIANTFFMNGIGIGFINNTQGMTNLIIDKSYNIEIQILRGDCFWSIDHILGTIKEGEIIKFNLNPYNNVKLLNYKDVFMCSECRNKRHSAYVNTIFHCM